MSSPWRFIILCVVWALAFAFLTIPALVGYGSAATALALVAGFILIPGSAWVAAGMVNRSWWDATARCGAMLLLLAVCLVAIAGVGILFIRATTTGGYH